MELLEGQTLKRPHRRQAASRCRQLLELGIQIADALECGAREGNRAPRHQAREHLPRGPRGQAKILDFGLAKRPLARRGRRIGRRDGHADAIPPRPHLTSPGSSMGTIAVHVARAGPRARSWTRGPTCSRSASCSTRWRRASRPSRARPRRSSSTAILHAATRAGDGAQSARCPRRCRPHSGQGAREGSATCDTRRPRSSSRPEAAEARPRLGPEGAAEKTASGSEAPAAAARQRSVAVTVFREPERREGRRVLSRRDHRRHHHGALEDQAARDLSRARDAGVPRQARDRRRRSASSSAPPTCSRAAIRRAGNRAAHHRAARGRADAALRLGRALRPARSQTCSRSRRRSPATSRRRCGSRSRRRKRQTIARKPTENLLAYDCYLRGRSYARRENMDYALQMFEQAIQLDPNFALAHAGDRQHVRDDLPAARTESEVGRARSGGLRPGDGAGARACAEVLVGACAASSTRRRSTTRAPWRRRRAIERKPDCEGSWNILGRAYFAAGRFEEAAALTGARHRGQRRRLQHLYSLHAALERLGRKKEARGVPSAQVAGLEQAARDSCPRTCARRILLATNLASLHEDEGEMHAASSDRGRASPRRSGHASTTRPAPTASWGKRPRRSKRSRRRLRPDTAIGIGQRRTPISRACTTIRSSRNWSLAPDSPRRRRGRREFVASPFPAAQTAVPKSFPTAAVTAMASALQNVTRIAPLSTLAPPARAATPPRSARNASEVPATTGIRACGGVAARDRRAAGPLPRRSSTPTPGPPEAAAPGEPP